MGKALGPSTSANQYSLGNAPKTFQDEKLVMGRLEAIGWTPDRLSIGGSIGLPVGKKWDIYGLDFSILWTCSPEVRGLQISGLVNFANNVRGIDLGAFNIVSSEIYGVQVGCCNLAENLHGSQVGVFNYAHEGHGVQFGFMNYAETSTFLVQIGVINVIKDNRCPVLPILNAYF